MPDGIFFYASQNMLVVLLVIACVLALLLHQARRRHAALENQRALVFDFLHRLGAAFSEDVHSHELHRLIVESIVHITKADSGVLYILDKSHGMLVPAFASANSSPLIPLPYELANDSDADIAGFVASNPVHRTEGAIGAAWSAGHLCIMNREHLLKLGVTRRTPEFVLAIPLIYRRKTLGVLAVGRHAPAAPFHSEEIKIFQALSDQAAFSVYTDSIYLLASEKLRLDHDLSTAREIQASLLPDRAPDFDGYQICGINIPMQHVSGDFYDYLPVDDTHLGVVIADVSGSGVPAAIVMAICRSVLRSEARGRLSAADVLRRVNEQLYPDMKEDMFISLAYCILEKGTGRAVMARAGHDAPLLYRNGATEKLLPKGMALGIDKGTVFNRVIADYEFTLAEGDCLLLYTDGTTEAQNNTGEEFGLDRLTTAMLKSAPHDATQVITSVIADLRTFIDSSTKYDDITLLAIRKT